MPAPLKRTDRLGLIRPAIDAHTLGISCVEQLLSECGYKTIVADTDVCQAWETLDDEKSVSLIGRWVREKGITVLGLSYRLDPTDGTDLVGRLLRSLKSQRLLVSQGGPLKTLYFAGLPQTCRMVRSRHSEISGVFQGDETAAETLRMLGIDPSLLPRAVSESVGYDESRLAFGRDVVSSGRYLAIRPVDRSGYETFGTSRDTVLARIDHCLRHRQPPLIRAHAGPYLHNRQEAVELFLKWARELADAGFLDVLSIGTSQLTQSRFGEDWGSAPNGGGVPINSEQEFAAVWQASRPMLVRTYAGTKDIPSLAQMYERTINIAWHALSLWWFCRIDGRGPNTLLENLRQHVETLSIIARTGKPFEPNVQHHFAFRGADDVTYVVSAILAAHVAKKMGVRHLILQNMLNTPKTTWGVQDLAKSRAMLGLTRELEDDHFRVFLQPRGGLDYFSHDPNKATAQLAAVAALMDDIEPHNPASPPLIHVVSYSEAFRLADPAVVNKSIQITRYALNEYRRLRAKGYVDDMTENTEVESRTAELVNDARVVLRAISKAVPNACTPEGLYRIFAKGFLPVPYLSECRDEFPKAAQWQTRMFRGSVKLVDVNGLPLSIEDRIPLL